MPATTLSPGETTLPTTTKPLPPLDNFQASKVMKFEVCEFGLAAFLEAPPYYTIYIEKLLYGITDNGECQEYSPDHCLAPALVTCNHKGNI